MRFITFEKTEEELARITMIHYFPEMLDEEMLSTGKLVEDFEEPALIDGKMSVAYYNQTTKEVVFQYEDIIVVPKEEKPVMVAETITKVEFYKRLNKETATIEEVRTAKHDAIKETCDNKILGGFYSKTMDATFDFSLTDQLNMTQQMLIFMVLPQPVMWKTEDKGLVELTKEQFTQLCFEAGQHKQAQIGKWWMLKANILAAQTKEEIIAIEWDGTIL